VAALKASNTETELLEKKMEWTWMCPICKIGMKSDANFQSHLAGKKHKANVVKEIESNLHDLLWLPYGKSTQIKIQYII
jgi:hypothetical protein